MLLEDTIVIGKTCSKCGIYKPYSEFHKNTRTKDGCVIYCKECNKEHSRTWYHANPEKRNNRATRLAGKYEGITNKICAKCNKLKPFSEFYKSSNNASGHKPTCKACVCVEETKRASNRTLSITHKICSTCGIDKPVTDFVKDKYKSDGYHQECRACKAIYKKEYYKKNREWLIKQGAQRLHTSIQSRLSHLLRTRITGLVRSGTKAGSAVRDLGCSIIFLKEYLEQKFYNHPTTNEPMTWKNRGQYGWHVDHIKPLVQFDLTNREQFLQACHYTNLQPLWCMDNLRKGAL